jgi:hypothetical protein
VVRGNGLDVVTTDSATAHKGDVDAAIGDWGYGVEHKIGQLSAGDRVEEVLQSGPIRTQSQ